MNLSRRNLLKLGVGAVALGTVGTRTTRLFAQQAEKKIPIALQLYSLRDIAGKDVPGTIEAVAKMGYQGVEFAGYHGMQAEELRKILDQNGLVCCGTHTGLDTLLGDSLKNTIEFNKILGNRFLIVPGLPATNVSSLAALIDTAKLFTDLAAKVKGSGMKVGYHAHGGDFKPVADRIPWEVLFGNAGPDVLMQLDIGNTMGAGADPIAMLKKFPHRSATIHLKEHGGPAGAVVGEGDAPWQEVFSLCETTGDTEWYIVEQETYSDSPLESVKRCLENLRKMGK
jgi:sugar phosphate isomerase/epimerase